MDNYLRMKEQSPTIPEFKTLLFGYISEAILYILIIVYCILSPSLFSSIALAFMLVSVFFTIATPYYLIRIKEEKKIEVVAYPVERLIWAIFLLVNLGIFGFKISVLIMDSYDNYTTTQQEFLQIQNYLYMFLPLLLLPFTCGSLIIRTKNRRISEFKTKLNSGIVTPLFLAMGIFGVLIQIFSVSVAGFCFFLCVLWLFVQRKMRFSNYWSEILTMIICLLCFGFIFANFFATNPFIQNMDYRSIFMFYGIDALNNFLSSSFQQGYFICLILEFLLTAFMERLFIYFRIWKVASEELEIGEIQQQQIFGEQGVQIAHERSPSADLQLHQQPEKKVRGYSLRQFEMQSVRSSEVIDFKPKHNTENLNFKSLPLEQESNLNPKEPTKNISNATKVYNAVLKGINTFADFIYSTEFSLRVTQLLSIVVIQRYNNIYSFVAVLWLGTVASVEKIRFIMTITGLILLPVQLINYIIMFCYNSPENPLQNYTNLQIYGFQKMSDFWLDVIIFNLYFFYMITYLLAASRDSRQTLYQNAKKPEKSIWVLFLAFLFRYTYLLTILGLFFLGFSTVNLMYLVYVIMFLVFFSSGENILIDKRTRGQKVISKFTTFSRKYWFWIVYYTIACIIIKYIYFLFFPGQIQEQLAPTGINLVYHWSFNFSLSSTCLSNTTPLFIIFVLSESQIIIFRSPIYLNYSFSLMSTFDDTNNKKISGSILSKLIQISLQFYYQSLYYISGFVILICSYRWDLNGFITVILACWGLLTGFSKKILALIVFFDLGFMLANYVALFIDYEIIKNILGENATNVIYKISLLLGFKMNSIYNLTYIFALNIVIFYFSVESYRLCKIIEQSRFDEQGRVNMEEPLIDEEQKAEDFLSNFGETVIESESEEKQFAKRYNESVIIGTKRLYNANLWRKYSVWFKVCRFLSIFMIDIITILIIAFCLIFRVSVSMFYYLCLYMFFYYNLFDEVGNIMQITGFYSKIFSQIQRFKSKEEFLLNRENPRSMMTGQQATESLISFIQQSRLQALRKKFKWKKYLWKFSAIFSAICLIISYASQFLNSEFYTTYMNYSWTLTLEEILFVLGVSVLENASYAAQTYVYYLMMGAAVVEHLLLNYLEDTESEVEQEENPHKSINMKAYEEFSETELFIDLQCDFIENIQTYRQIQIQPNKEIIEEQDKDFSKQANLLIYFEYKKTNIYINITYGFMMVLLRFYLLMMLINLYEQENIFSFAYLIAVLIFWFRPTKFQLVKDINKAAIIILILQYFLLLFDISESTSPLPLPGPPGQDNLSLLQKYLPQVWINFLLYDIGSNSFSIFISAFVVSSIIIFLTQFYFTIFFWISKTLIGYIRAIYDRYEYIQQNLLEMPEHDTVYLNFTNYKSTSYRILNLSYEILINNSYVVVSILILILLSNVHTYVGFGLVVFACIYIYLGIFTAVSEDIKIYSYTTIFFKIIRGILFLILIVTTIAAIPILDESSETLERIENLTNLSQIFLIMFIQLWLDLSVTKQFQEATQGYNKRVKNRENVLIKCLAYQQNEGFIRRLIQRYKQVMWFEVNLGDALEIIEQWHKNMYKQKIPQFQNIKDNLAPLPMEDLRKQIKADLARRPDEDQPLINRFQEYMADQINVTVKYRYYETMKFIVFSNHRIIKLENQNIDIWDYVLENYEKLYDQIQEAEESLATITKAIQSEDEGKRMERLQQIKEATYSQISDNLDEELIGKINTPKKIFLDIKHSPDTFMKIFWDFFISNFSYFLSFFIWIYYLINPCLLSLPFIIYIFSYQIISNSKLTSLMLLYTFTIIIFALLVQLDMFSTSSSWIQYFFLNTGSADSPSYMFAVGYLYFIFILIFINEQIKKYQGNKFKFTREAENTLQGALRIMINTDQQSELNLWKMKTDVDYEEKQCNPLNYFAEKVQKHPQHLTDMPIPSFFEAMQEGKTGSDLYPYIASIQIFLTIYMIFLYPLMVHSQTSSLQESFKYFQFSSQMVLAVLANVIVIVLERWITLMRDDTSRKLKIKYWYTMVILGLFLTFIYYIAPKNPFVKNQYYPQPCLIAFSFFYFFYFFLSALQIRFGYKKYKSLNSIMSRRRQLNNFLLIGYVNIPFLYELKLSMDWSFCETSLKIFDWFRLFSIYYSAFKAKMQYYSSTGVTLGNPVSSIMKSLGWITFIGILLIIFLPMILFSGLNPIAQDNLVIGGTLTLGIQQIKGNYFELYSTTHFAVPPVTYTYDAFISAGFNDVPFLSTLTSNDVQSQFQYVQYQAFSDNNWGISHPNYEALVNRISDAIDQKTDAKFQILVSYELNRRVAATIPQNNKFYYPSQNEALNSTYLQKLKSTLTSCNQSLYFSDFYIDLIRLNTVGDTYKPRPILYNNSEGIDPYLEGIYLTLYCNGHNATEQTNDDYWAVNTTSFRKSNSTAPTQLGINLNVYCDKYQNLIGGLGFTALYTSVILVVANMIRGAFQADLPNIPYFQNPKSDNIIQISEAIGTLRARRQFRQEYLMYYQLIDIIRSPDMMKYLSGSFPSLIQEADAKRRRIEKQKQMQALKDKIQ